MDEHYHHIQAGLREALAPLQPVRTDAKLAWLRRTYNAGRPNSQHVSAEHLRETLESMCQPGKRPRSNRWFVAPTSGRKRAARWRDTIALGESDNQQRLIVFPKSHAMWDYLTPQEAMKHGAVIPLWQRKDERGKTKHQCLMHRIRNELDVDHPVVGWSIDNRVDGSRWYETPFDNWQGQIMAETGLLSVDRDYARPVASGESFWVCMPNLTEHGKEGDRVYTITVHGAVLLAEGKKPTHNQATMSFFQTYGEHGCKKGANQQTKQAGRKTRRLIEERPDLEGLKIFSYKTRARYACNHRCAARQVGEQFYREKGYHMPRGGPRITRRQEKVLKNMIRLGVLERPLSRPNDSFEARFGPLPQAYLSRLWFVMEALGYR